MKTFQGAAYEESLEQLRCCIRFLKLLRERYAILDSILERIYSSLRTMDIASEVTMLNVMPNEAADTEVQIAAEEEGSILITATNGTPAEPFVSMASSSFEVNMGTAIAIPTSATHEADSRLGEPGPDLCVSAGMLDNTALESLFASWEDYVADTNTRLSEAMFSSNYYFS